jgi:sensor c-di-GMP phosphodiesterase-like protein
MKVIAEGVETDEQLTFLRSRRHAAGTSGIMVDRAHAD